MSFVAAAIGIGGAVGGALISSSAAGNAASAQEDASKYAADLQYKASQDALAYQQQVYNDQKVNQAPWLQAGQGAISTLSQLTKTPGQGLLTPWTEEFQAPTTVDEKNDPGYAARLKMGTDALQRSAAARGGLLTGGTAKALDQYAQDYASNEYGNVYNRALGEYQQKYNIFENNQNNEYNRLAGISGTGQTAASNLNSAGTSAANNVSSNLLNTASAMGQDYTNAAAARASGYIGSANAWSGALSGLGSAASNLYSIYKTNKNSGVTAEDPYGLWS